WTTTRSATSGSWRDSTPSSTSLRPTSARRPSRSFGRPPGPSVRRRRRQTSSSPGSGDTNASRRRPRRRPTQRRDTRRTPLCPSPVPSRSCATARGTRSPCSRPSRSRPASTSWSTSASSTAARA
ncbi:MAG: hypothetical protein AVDCRST_MAG60-2126, partial [uncultured Nocardioides sp.]